jgi:tRNA-dihydrouridine synthase B
MSNFWKKFNDKPILALAPMAGVADAAFRRICKPYGVDVLYSEMASVTALVYAPEKTLELVAFKKEEQPYIVQLFGSKHEHFAAATKIITEKVRPDGIDINFGCPVKKIQKQGAGAVLMKDMNKAKDCIKATIDNTNLPISIKTRVKVGDVSMLDFLDKISDLDIKALMIHGRSLAQGFSGDIDTAAIKKAKEYFGGTILANGGINNTAIAKQTLEKTKVNGLGIARGCMGRPWIFEEIKKGADILKNKNEIFEIALKHAKLAHELKGDLGIIEMRKHLCWYVTGMLGAKEFRRKLIRVNTLNDIKKILT